MPDKDNLTSLQLWVWTHCEKIAPCPPLRNPNCFCEFITAGPPIGGDTQRLSLPPPYKNKKMRKQSFGTNICLTAQLVVNSKWGRLFEPKETFLHLSACHPPLLSFHYLLQVTFSFCFFVCYFPWQITVTLSGNKISLFSEEVTLSAEGP